MTAPLMLDHGPPINAWTCHNGPDCRGDLDCPRRDRTLWHGSPEEVALAHGAEHSSERVHVIEDGRRRTFKVWRAEGRLFSREVL